MIKAILLIFAPASTWTKISEAKRGVLTVLFLNPLPLMLLACAAEAYGLMHLGVLQSDFARAKPVPVAWPLVLKYEEMRLAANLAVLFLGAQILYWLDPSVNVRARYQLSFTVIGYSLGPVFLMQALDGLPWLSTWMCWAVGIILAMHLVYHGVALVLQPDQTKGFGLFLVSSLVLTLLSLTGQILALSILHDRVFRF